MPNRITELVTKLIAKDDASKVIEHVADDLDKLEKKGDVAVGITADDKASADIRTVTERLAGLSDEDKTIVLEAQVTDAERGIARILRSLKDVDKLDDEEVTIRVEALDHARDDLDRIHAEMRDLDGTTAEVTVEGKGLDDVLDKLDSLPGKLGEIGGSLGALGTGGAVVAGVGAIGAALFQAADDAATAATEVATMQQLTGDSAEEASRLQAVWKTTGADVNDLNDIILQMNGVLADDAELAASLGVNLGDGATGGQRFVEVMEKIDHFTGTAQEKAVLMSKLLGEEGARQGAKMLAVVEDINVALSEVPDELIYTDAEIARANEMKIQIAELKTEFEEISIEVGQNLIPLIGDLANSLGPVVETLSRGLPAVPLVGRYAADVEQILMSQGRSMQYYADKFGILNTEVQAAAAAGRLKNLAPKVEMQNLDRVYTALKNITAATKDRTAATEAATAAEIELAGEAAEGVVAQIETLVDEAEAVRDAIREWPTAIEDAAVAAAETQIELDKMAGVFEQMGASEDALSSIFDLKNASLDAQADIRDVELAIEGLSDVDVDLSKAAQKEQLLDSIDALRPQIQERITAAFAGGGPEAAVLMAQDYIKQVAEELGISEIEAAKLLGLEDIMATVGVAIDAKDLANAQAQLTLLTGIPGADPVWVATVQLALAAGDITAEQTARLVQDKLRDLGVPIPASLEVATTPEQLKQAMIDAGLLDPHDVPAKVIPDTGAFYEKMSEIEEGAFSAEVELIPVLPQSLSNVPYDVIAPAGLSAGTHATTVTPMSSGGGLAMPVTVVPQPTVVNLHSHLHAAVIGSPFDVARAIEEGMRRTARLMPKHP